jgi:hypothetical protein
LNQANLFLVPKKVISRATAGICQLSIRANFVHIESVGLSSAPLFFKRESHYVWGLSRQPGLSERGAERGAKLALKAKNPPKR